MDPAHDDAPSYLILGHVTHDIVPGGVAVGGTATFAALTAAHLGERVAVVTAASFDPAPALPGIAVHVRPSEATTTYENVYTPSGRRQFLRAVAARLSIADVPPAWRTAPIVHLAPLADELRGGIVTAFPDAFVGVTPQGWLRWRDPDGVVHVRNWNPADAEPVLARADAIVLSEEDVAQDERVIADLAARARLLVVTRGPRGARTWVSGELFESAAFECQEVEPTGAGDVFAAALFSHLHRTGDPVEAVRWAHCVASFAVEGSGTSAVPSRERVLERLHRGVMRR